MRAVQFDVFNVVYEQGSVRMDNVMVIEGVKGASAGPGIRVRQSSILRER